MTTQQRIDELKQCPEWESHVTSLEALALELDDKLCREREAHNKTREEVKTWHQHYKDELKKAQSWKEWSFEQSHKLEKSEAENARLKAQLARAHEELCRHGIREYGN